MEQKTLFNFDNYRTFLKFYIKQMPQSRGLLKGWAQHLGVHSTLISQVMMGKRDFTEEQGLELSHFIGLNKIEREYFLELLRLDRSGTQKLRAHAKERLEELKTKSLQLSERLQVDRKVSEEESAIFYSSWMYSAIRLCCSIAEGLTVDEIAEKLSLPRSLVLSALNFLRDSGFVQQKGVRYVIGTQYTHLGKGSPYMTRHHANWRVKALQRADQLSDKELMYTSPFSISEKDFEILREHMVLVIQDFLKTVKASDGEMVACFNLDLFKIT